MAVNVSLKCATIVAWRKKNETKDGFVLLFLHVFRTRACVCVGARKIINGKKWGENVDKS